MSHASKIAAAHCGHAQQHLDFVFVNNDTRGAESFISRRRLVHVTGEGHRFSAHSSGNEFSMRFVFALYVCIVALGLICAIAVSVA